MLAGFLLALLAVDPLLFLIALVERRSAAVARRGLQEHALQNWSAERLLTEMKELYYQLTGSAKATAQGA